MLRQARWSLLLLALFAGVLAVRAQTLPDKRTPARKTSSTIKQEIRKTDSIVRAAVVKDSASFKRKLTTDTATLKAAMQKTFEGRNASFQNGAWKMDAPNVPKLKDGKVDLPSADELTGKLNTNNLTKSGKRIYSHAGLRKLYDSLGISKLDTLLALANARKNVSQEELLRSVVSSFPGHQSPDALPSPEALTDLSKLNLLSETGMELPPIEGFTTHSAYGLAMDSLKEAIKTSFERDKLKALYQQKLDSLTANRVENSEQYKVKWDSLSTLDPNLVKNMPLPTKYQQLVDSLKQGGGQKWEQLDSVAGKASLQNKLVQLNRLQKVGTGYEAKWDSVKNLSTSADQLKTPLIARYQHLLDSMNRVGDSTLNKGNLYKRKLDSIRQVADKTGIRMREEKVTDDFKSVVLQKRPDFLQRINFEGIVGILSNSDSVQILQFSPAIDFSLIDNLTLGVGPNLIWSKTKNGFTFHGGYRIFSKYYFLKQRLYLQLEDSVEPGRIKSETVKTTPHSALVGMGGLVKISHSLFINVALLYRVNNNQYSNNLDSPLVFRIGLSSIKPISHE